MPAALSAYLSTAIGTPAATAGSFSSAFGLSDTAFGPFDTAFGPFDTVVGSAAQLVAALSSALVPLAGANATALAIVAATIAVRLLLSPLSWLQVRAESRRAALAPQLRELNRRYADEPRRLAVETMALYRSAGASPLAGCLPAVLQAPFFVLMYQLVTQPVGSDGGALLAGSFLGVGLDTRPAGLAGADEVLVFVGVLTVVLMAAWATSRRLRRAVTSNQTGAAPAGGVLQRVMPLLPYGSVAVALVLPLAAGLYLAATTSWTALEQALLPQWDGIDRC
ncbi:membrane protein insertase YidC [Solwaraspora sp. WMMB335]|uniref:YidC/Oxa1 family membrane protein insertase n=1 Tax=Solwaraspora sp. WMMB335 TaxID=3404118 RepID=UPI003B93ABC6